MTRASVRRRGMNMRDMKQRSMGRVSGGLGASPPRSPKPEARSPIDDEVVEHVDPFAEAIHVDQGDGSFTAQSGYDGGGEEQYELPDSPPDGWWG